MLAEVSGCNPSLGEQCDLNKLDLHSSLLNPVIAVGLFDLLKMFTKLV